MRIPWASVRTWPRMLTTPRLASCATLGMPPHSFYPPSPAYFFCRLADDVSPAPPVAHASNLAACSRTERFEVPPVASRRSTAASKSQTAMT